MDHPYVLEAPRLPAVLLPTRGSHAMYELPGVAHDRRAYGLVLFPWYRTGV